MFTGTTPLRLTGMQYFTLFRVMHMFAVISLLLFHYPSTAPHPNLWRPLPNEAHQYAAHNHRMSPLHSKQLSWAVCHNVDECLSFNTVFFVYG